MARCRCVGVAVLPLLLLAACEPETRVIRYDPFLARLPGAEGGKPPVGLASEPLDKLAEQSGKPEELVVKNADGSVKLVARKIRHVMVHLFNTLRDEDADLLYEQVVSSATKRHFEAEKPDARAYILSFLKEHEQDISALFARMPAAEQSPGVRLTKTDERAFKLELMGSPTRGLRFTTLWVVMEQGQWRLYWVS